MKVLLKNGKIVSVSRKVANSIFKKIETTGDIDELGLIMLSNPLNGNIFVCDLREIVAIY